MVIIGVDPHKRTHTASAIAPEGNTVLATMQIDASLSGYRRLLRWAAAFGQHQWAVENARGLGRHLAQWLLARGEVVEDVPSTATATARVRELSRVADTKTMSSTPPQQPASPHCAEKRTRCRRGFGHGTGVAGRAPRQRNHPTDQAD